MRRMTPTFEAARAAFPVLEEVAYLNAGTFGPLSRGTADAMKEAIERDLEHGRCGASFFQGIVALRADVRSRLADLVGAAADTIALTTSTTDGCNLVLAGL